MTHCGVLQGEVNSTTTVCRWNRKLFMGEPHLAGSQIFDLIILEEEGMPSYNMKTRATSLAEVNLVYGPVLH